MADFAYIPIFFCTEEQAFPEHSRRLGAPFIGRKRMRTLFRHLSIRHAASRKAGRETSFSSHCQESLASSEQLNDPGHFMSTDNAPFKFFTILKNPSLLPNPNASKHVREFYRIVFVLKFDSWLRFLFLMLIWPLSFILTIPRLFFFFLVSFHFYGAQFSR